MAIVPLFVADLSTLKAKCRLSGLPSNADSEALFEQAVTDARLGFLDRIGSTRASQIVALTHSDNPLTADEQTRSLAESTEVKWVRLKCYESMPVAQIDGAPLNQIWNTEAPFRGLSSGDLRALMAKLESEIADALEKLAGTVEQESGVAVTDIGPKCPRDLRDVFNSRRGDPWR